MEGSLMFWVTPKVNEKLSEDANERELKRYQLAPGEEYLCIEVTREDRQGVLQLLIVLKDGSIRYVPGEKVRAVMPFRVYNPGMADRTVPAKKEKAEKKAVTDPDDDLLSP